MSQHLKSPYLPASACLLLTGLLLYNPQLAAEGFQSGLHLCIRTILPALFPYFVLCELLMACPLHGRILAKIAQRLGMRHENAGMAVLLSWFGGYAVCARLTRKLNKEHTIDKRESILLLLLGCCSSPGFVIGCIGGMLFKNVRLGVLLYGLQLAANLLSTAVCLPFLPPQAEEENFISQDDKQTSANLAVAINTSVSSCMSVCGCVLFFRILASVLQPLLPIRRWSEPLLCAILEISSGCAAFSTGGGRFALYGCCACLSLLGISVWVQVSALLEGTVSLRLLAISRLLHLVLFLALVYLFARLLPGTISTYTTLENRVVTMHRLPWDAAIVVFFFVCATLYKVRQNFYNR